METITIIAILIYAINVAIASTQSNFHSAIGWLCCIILAFKPLTNL